MEYTLHAYNNRESLIEGLARHIQASLTSGLGQREQASMVLAGGSTPMPLYAALARADLPWENVTALPSDERWVPATDPASNHLQISRQFGKQPLQLGRLVPEAPGTNPDTGTARQVVATLPEPFDAVVLGMGGDGHFASLFPHSPALAEGLDPDSRETALVVTPDPLPPDAPFARISLTLARLLHARELILLITGEDKRLVLEEAARADADPETLPIAALIRAAGKRLNVFWSP
ncbi:6-phosphogluconolactonase [Wenzhouxiangella sp. AB-CW3]|uniref:6-phosphogluconolactonase n=1 Tax=Wenzhouxiangella sp. AB-CW3 TaxID=2771012 RepID=UPI00168AA492|nr:6-phosphogluconolactonase [Wenzhouxiangella sp. AB-CW3]QOC23028.1 6-phosphogluconolactonase [Wenzhouxiangella sp. AB-CW3]